MIDWTNLIAGFLLGLIPTAALWLADHHSSKRQRRNDVLDAWRAAAKDVELQLFHPDTTASDLYRSRVRHPIDSWREVLGSEGFALLEQVENAYQAAEYRAGQVQHLSATQQDVAALQKAAEQRRAAIVAFSNYSRSLQDESYCYVVTREERAKLRRDYLAHPITTWRRERHNRRVRVANDSTDPRKTA